MEKEKRTQAKRPRDEDFEGGREPRYREQEEVDEFERHKQSPWVILGIVGTGIAISLVALLVYGVFSGKRRPVINVITPTASEENVTQSSGVSEGGEKETRSDDTGNETEPVAEESSEETKSVNVEQDGILYQISNGYAAVSKCKSTAETVILPDSVDGFPLKAIWNNAFDGCTHLKYVKIPEGVWSVGEYAFANIGELKEIVFPASLSSMGNHCFDYTGGMTFISPANCFAAQVAAASGISWLEGNDLAYAH